MQCQTTLDQLRSFLEQDESPADANPQLRAHVSDCPQCRSRLDWLTQDRLLVNAATRARSKHRHKAVESQASAPLRSRTSDHREPPVRESEWRQLAIEQLESKTQTNQGLRSANQRLDRESADLSGLLDHTRNAEHSGTCSLGMIGRYQAQAVVGRGGMSMVFAAWDPKLHRQVAIKVLKSVHDQRNWRRFAREARAAARIVHDAVVPLYEVVERDDRPPALVMPLMSAGTLQDKLELSPIDPNHAAQITARIAAGLQEVHRHQHVHRDIKPGNVLFDDQGNAKLGDFSLVRRDEDETLTQANVVPGTPEYIAPELLNGGTADARSDIYQLGLTLYTMLAGTPPFRGTVRSVLQQIANDSPPRLQQHRALGSADAIPRDLETICMKAIEREPDDRYQRAEAFGDDLQRFLAGQPISAQRPRLASRARRLLRRHPVKVAAGAIAIPCLLLLSISFVAIQSQHRQHQQESDQLAAQQEIARKQLADEKHRADLAELKSTQALSQSFSTVLSAQQIREPDWIDTEKTVVNALLSGLEQGYEQMQLAPERNPNFGAMSLTIANLRAQAGQLQPAASAFKQAIAVFSQRLDREPTEMMWQHMANARRGYGVVCKEMGSFSNAIEQLEFANEICQNQTNTNMESLKWKLEWVISETELGQALIAAGRAAESDSHFDSAAIRVRVIATADKPKTDVVGFGTKFADAASKLAQAYRSRGRIEKALSIQRVAVTESQKLGNDEASQVKKSDAFAETAILLALDGRPAASLQALRRSIESLDQAIAESRMPGRYDQRRARLQSHQKRITHRMRLVRANAATSDS